MPVLYRRLTVPKVKDALNLLKLYCCTFVVKGEKGKCHGYLNSLSLNTGEIFSQDSQFSVLPHYNYGILKFVLPNSTYFKIILNSK